MRPGTFKVDELTGPERAALRASCFADPRILYFGFPILVGVFVLMFLTESAVRFHDVFVVVMFLYVAFNAFYTKIGFVRLLGRLQSKLDAVADSGRTA